MGGFSLGFNAGLAGAQRGNAEKRALSDEEHEQVLTDHNNTIQALQTKMAEVGPNDPSYSQYQGQLNQTLADRTALFHPSNPGAMERLGKMLWQRVHGKEAPPTDAPRLQETPIAGSQGQTMPGMTPGAPAVTSPTLPDSSTLTDTQPWTHGTTPAAVKARAAEELGWAAPLKPKPTLGTPQWLTDEEGVKHPFALQDGKFVHVPGAEGSAPGEKAEKANWEQIGGTQNGQPVLLERNKADGSYRRPGETANLDAGDLEGFVPTPKAQHQSNTDKMRAEYAASHNLDPTKPLPWKDELAIKKQMAIAGNPYGPQRLQMQREGLDLREADSDFKDFLATQKTLAPMQRVEAAADSAADDVKAPTGPGDAQLTLAFFDAIKTTGVRFTKQEQDFIIGSRGVVDGAQAKLDGGFSGTLYGPPGSEQRALIAGIVKKAGQQAQKQQGTVVRGAGAFKPRVAAAIAGAGSNTSSTPSKGARSLKQAMALPINKGKTAQQVTDDLKLHGYEVKP